MKVARTILISGLAASLLGSAHAQLAFKFLYQSHMVLQRHADLPIRGTARPGTEVTVTFAGQSKKATAGEDGKWLVTLDPIKAGGPYILAAQGGVEEVKLDDILVGDVWVASGQSNMAWMVRQSLNGKKEAEAAASLTLFRACYIPYVATKEEPQEAPAQYDWFKPDNAEAVGQLSGQGFFFARKLVETLNIPIGLISVSKGGTPAEAFMRRELLEADPDFRPILERMEKYDKEYPTLKAAWDADAGRRDAGQAKLVAEARAAGKNPPPPKRLVPPDYHSRPCGLWNSMVGPLVEMPIKGVVWNQGVSNSKYSEVYGKLFQTMIKDWRTQWKCGEFPFIYIQIERNNNYKTLEEAPVQAGDNEWAEIREQQARSLATPNTYMVPAVDQGDDSTSRHPLDKQTPGKRLANMALRYVYGMKDVVGDAPRFKSIKRVDGGFEVEFSNGADGLKVAGDKLDGFAVGTAERKWMWTEAKISGKNTVFIKLPAGMPNAEYVRYNWAEYTLGNLYGTTGLPAEPFRTDSFPYLTAGKR